MASNTTESSTQSKNPQLGESDKVSKSIKCPEISNEQPQIPPDPDIIKSGPLFLSSRGIGWTQWKKRLFILTPTSLTFCRIDPNVLPQKGIEANTVLGAIDFSNSGSIVVKTDKKFLTISIPDAPPDARTFTLKGETSEELQEWKTALENAIEQAPSATASVSHSGSFRTETANSVEASFEQRKDVKPTESTIIGRPVLLALEDVDGSPSFLEKALRFIEDYGIKVEGILRQSADVEEVLRRFREYEQGKNEFSPDEDAHVIGDCIKYVLRELPSSPVPASCCTALVEAYTCMAPLLLRPLLAGECEFEDNFNMGGDGSLQLLKAAAAANHAQAIVIIMLEEFEIIFDEEFSQDGSYSSDSYTGSEEEYDIVDDESTDNDILEDEEYHGAHDGLDADTEDDLEHSSSGTLSGSSSYLGSDLSENEEDRSPDSSSPGDEEDVETTERPSNLSDATTSVQDIGQKQSTGIPPTQDTGAPKNGVLQNENSNSVVLPNNQDKNSVKDVHTSSNTRKSVSHTSSGNPASLRKRSTVPTTSMRRPTRWGHTSGRKNLSMESIDFSTDDESAIQRLETTKSDLETKIAKEVKGNAVLYESLEKRKEALHERRSALEKDVETLQEQLEKERDLRASLESGLMNMRPGHVSITSTMDGKTRADLEEINLTEADIINLKQKVTDLRGQLSRPPQSSSAPLCASCNRKLDRTEKDVEKIVDSALPCQNENSPKSDASSSNVASENARAQKRNLPSSPDKATRQTNEMRAVGYSGSSSTEESAHVKSTTKFSDADGIVSSSADSAVVRTKSQSSSSSPKAQSRKKKPSKKSKDKTHSLESGSISSNENPMVASDHENHGSEAKDSHPLTEKKLTEKALQGDEAMPVVFDSSSKILTLKGENPKLGSDMDTENGKAHNQNSPTLADAGFSQKLQKQTTNKSRTKSNDTSSTDESATLTRNFASKRSSFRVPDLKDETPSVGRNATSRKSFKYEERRVQLAKELQDLDANNSSEPAPLPTTSR
ncbi:uncharacterized protein A4U43_C03F15540 [Asparagus officinalis]|uniref:Rho-GAP domain-containing protein n=1 Tax=Asparagus officinalis TaxID=4686 RepID=A0A5P1FAW0_ASPOF|nr:uncharacterized protein A4U43_C03F15540 [Asparagus officinalis]